MFETAMDRHKISIAFVHISCADRYSRLNKHALSTAHSLGWTPRYTKTISIISSFKSAAVNSLQPGPRSRLKKPTRS